MPKDRENPNALMQGDLSINLFMVLLSVLSALTILATVASSQGFRQPVRSEDAQNVPLALTRGWSPVPELRDLILVRADGLYMLDGMALADTFVTAGRLDPGDNSRLFAQDRDPQAYHIQLAFYQGGIPDGYWSWHLDPQSLAADSWPARWTDLLATGTPVDLAIYEGGETFAWQAATQLYDNGQAFRLLFQARDQVSYGRKTSLFNFEDVYK